MIIIEPLAGLSNRIRVIESAYNLSKKLNKKLVVIWNRNNKLNANFTDLFKKIPETIISEAEIKRFNLRNVFIHGLELTCKLTPNFKFLNDEHVRELRQEKFNFESLKKHKVIYIQTCMDFYQGNNFNNFKVNDFVEKKLSNKVKLTDVIGIHIRRGDNKWSIERSPTELFLNKCYEELENKPDVKFYLSTDDKNVESIFIKKFEKKILYHKKKTIDRDTKEGIIDAVIDLYNLSNCAKIYGSYKSSFSDMSSEIGGIHKTILEKH